MLSRRQWWRVIMSTAHPEISSLRQAVADALHRHWVLYLIEGIVLIVLGALAIVIPPAATLAVTIFIGWLLLISGLFGLITTFWMRPAPGFWWSLLSAALGIVAGGILIARPVTGALSLTLVLIAFFIIEGVASIMFALEHRAELPSSWGWMLASGIVDLVLSAMIFGGLPSTAAWAIGLLVGINLIFGGTSLTMMALQARRLGPGTA
jgi:uncharacterized membrane protein HdeD (DUF308 family)